MDIKINDCAVCRFLDKDNSACLIKDGESIRKCVIGMNQILVEELAKAGKNVRLLEIGCGSWSYLKDNLPANVSWEGIDPLAITDFGKKTIATKVGSVGNIPFEAESFDVVLANQSLEHWYEFGITFGRGLSEISRVLKTGGVFYANAPIHFHGHIWLVKGLLNKITGLFAEKYWFLNQEYWRRNPAPLQPCYGWKTWLRTDWLGRKKEGFSAWEINLIATKKESFRLNIWQKIKADVYETISKFLPTKIKTILNYGPFCLLKAVLGKFF